MAENQTETEAKDTLQNEQKNELGDEKKPNTSKKSFAIIFFLTAIILILYVLNPLSGDKQEEAAAKQEEEVVVKKKNFEQDEASSSNPFTAKIANGDSSYGSQNPFGDKNTQVVLVDQKQVIPKGLSGGAVPKSSTAASGGGAASTNPLVSSAVAASTARANELKQMAQGMQAQLQSLTNSALGGGEGGGSGRDIGTVENTAAIVVAKKSTLDPNLAIDKGTFIPCILKTAVISTIAGNIACVVTDDVYSAAGTVLLIEKGSLVQGSFRSGELAPGMNRLFVIWEEIKTPKRVVIDVNSPASDTLGGSGLDGWVDNHYMQRFGAAILLSMIDDTLSAIVSNTDGRDYTMNTRENSQDIAAEALKSTINIPPTLYKNHGDIVGIYVNKDVDFSKVYKLQRIWK